MIREHKGNSLLETRDTYTVIDIETTGFDPNKDKIIEIGAIKVKNGEVVDTYSTLINVDYIPDFILNLTGITMEKIYSAPKIEEIILEFYNFLGDSVLVGHNIHFDINFLYDNILSLTGNFLSNDFIDTLRLSKKYIKNISNYKLPTLIKELKLDSDGSHRALVDCYTTKNLYDLLCKQESIITEKQKLELERLKNNTNLDFIDKKFVVKGTLKYNSFAFLKEVSKIFSFNIGEIFYKNSDYLILNQSKYNRYINRKYSDDMFYDQLYHKAEQLETDGTLKVLSETMFYDLFNISYEKKCKNKPLKATDIVPETEDFDETHPLYLKTCVFTGTLEQMTRNEAMQKVVNLGGFIRNGVTTKTNYLILANNNYHPLLKDGKSSKQKKAEQLKAEGLDIEILSEDVFYDLINAD